MVKQALEESLTQILSPKRQIDILRDAKQAKQEGHPYSIVFCGVNGVLKAQPVLVFVFCVFSEIRETETVLNARGGGVSMIRPPFFVCV